VVAALGLAWVQVRPNLGDHLAGAPQGASVSTGCALRLVFGGTRRGPELFTRGRAERHRSGACPQQTRHPRPRPSPLGGPVHGSCPGPGAGKRRPGQVRRNNQRWRQLLWSQRVGRPGRCHRSAGRQSVAKPPAGGGAGGFIRSATLARGGSGVAAWPEAVSAESSSTAKWSPSATIMLFRHVGQGI
jgi:hypothetical protein